MHWVKNSTAELQRCSLLRCTVPFMFNDTIPLSSAVIFKVALTDSRDNPHYES